MYFPLSLTLIAISAETLRREATHRLTADRSHWDSQYDYIVVGAGSAGCVVANRLSADRKHTVLLLEAGGPPSAVLTDIPALVTVQLLSLQGFWTYFNVKQKNAGQLIPTGIPELLGKQLGGGSAVSYLEYNRGNPKDFDNWVNAYYAYGWSYAEVLPLFIKSENNSDQSIVRMNPGFHGTSGPIGVETPHYSADYIHIMIKVFNSLGFKTVDVNGPGQRGVSLLQVNVKDGLRSSSASAYIDPNPHPNSLHILTKAFVTKILIRKSMNKLIAFGVEFIKDNKLHIVLSNKEVILSAGAINSPKILMLSGIGPKKHLNYHKINVLADLPVGNNYANQVAVIIFSWLKDKSLGKLKPYTNGQQLPELYINQTLPYFPALGLYMSTSSIPDKSWPNVFIDIRQLFFSVKNFVTIYPTLVRPRSKGTIRLASSDPFEQPLIDPQFLAHPQDMDDMIEVTKFTLFVLTDTPLAKFMDLIKIPIPGCRTCADDRPIYYCDQYIRCLIRQTSNSNFAPVGSCRMGSVHRSDVVVSERLRVKNALNLRVCDSSVFPESINTIPNAASVMVGEKCAQMIREDDLYYDLEARDENTFRP